MSPPSRRSRKARPGAASSVRIIGGEWRGRRLAVADVAGLRPTGDRVRETLFNWLQPILPGARCLDLFAGSGALGLEALSRGAAHVTLVEPAARARDALEAAIGTLGAAPRARLVNATAEAFLRADATPFDIVFVDPPFDAASQEAVLETLLDGHLAPGARVYVEAPTAQPWSGDRAGPLARVRERVFGDVVARLLEHAS